MFRSLPRFALISNSPIADQSPYLIARRIEGNLPVYADLRNGGKRCIIRIRHVDGNAKILAKELKETLFEKNSPEYKQMKIEVIMGKTLMITGGQVHWRRLIMNWLTEKGF
ncbi:hypothetical protein F5887DRAFT_876079 [Amanita rubescens]|nr:hypothetical protein F5887DRAFT_876079 [Amanita rubescens]